MLSSLHTCYDCLAQGFCGTPNNENGVLLILLSALRILFLLLGLPFPVLIWDFMCSFITYCHICLLDINGDMAFSKVKRTVDLWKRTGWGLEGVKWREAVVRKFERKANKTRKGTIKESKNNNNGRFDLKKIQPNMLHRPC